MQADPTEHKGTAQTHNDACRFPHREHPPFTSGGEHLVGLKAAETKTQQQLSECNL